MPKRFYRRDGKPNNGNGTGNGKTPVLSETSLVERNPFLPPEVTGRGDALVTARADPTKEYVPSGQMGFYPFLKALPVYTDEIAQKFGPEIWDKMYADPVVYASERVLIFGMLANGHELVPSLPRTDNDYDIAKAMRDFIHQQIENLETPYGNLLYQHLTAFRRGVSVNEEVFTLEKRTKDDPRDTPAMKLALKDLRQRPLNNAIFVEDSYNNTVGILTQRFPGQVFPAGSFIPVDFAQLGDTDISKLIPGFLPRHHFSVLTNQMENNDERGHSGFHPAYFPWWFKQQTLGEYFKWMQHFASPSLVGTTKEGAQPEKVLNPDMTPVLNPDGSPFTRSPEQVLSAVLAEFANGTAIAIPFGAKVDTIDVGASGQGFVEALGWADSQIIRAITAQYLATAEGMHQSRASSETHQDILSLAILMMKQWLAEQQRREVFKRILMYNFDVTGKKIAKYVPHLNLGLGDGFPISPASIAQLMNSGYLDPSQFERLDDRIGLPKRENVVSVAERPEVTRVSVRENGQNGSETDAENGNEAEQDANMDENPLQEEDE